MEALIAAQEERYNMLVKAKSNYKKSPKDRIVIEYVEARLGSLERLWDDFYKVHAELILAMTPESKRFTYFTKDIFTQFEELYIEYKTSLKTELKVLNNAESAKINQSVEGGTTSEKAVAVFNNQTEVKLPQIKLPTFSGQYDEWQSYSDMFRSLIHTNQNLSAVQKLHYLKSGLTGEAALILQNLPTTEDNYEEAWVQLKCRYNNKKYNTNEILKKLFSQGPVAGSAQQIKSLLDNTTACLKALKNLDVNTNDWDPLIIYLVISKLDQESRKLWEIKVNENKPDTLPSWKELCLFLENRFRTLESLEPVKSRQITKVKTHHSTASAAIQPETKNKRVTNCIMCKSDHHLFQCKQFSKLTPTERTEFVKTNNICFNCFAPHSVKSCRQSACCRRCGRRHHTLLHYEKTTAVIPEKSKEAESQSTTIVANFACEDTPMPSESVLLATARINAKAKNGNVIPLRALLDQGSQASFVTEETAQILGLQRTPISGVVSSLGNSSEMRIRYMVDLHLLSRCNMAQMSVRAYVLKAITSLPSSNNSPSQWVVAENLELADPNYFAPGKIDVLLGADIYGNLLCDGVKRDPQSGLVAQRTVFGWILSGGPSSSLKIQNLHLKLSEDKLLQQFWQIESEPESIFKTMTQEEIKCEEQYHKTTQRNEQGRYVVKLPFKEEDPPCGYANTVIVATKRLYLLENKLRKTQKLKEDYSKVIQEYIDLNHMEEVPEQEIENCNAVYLPHHAVVREDKDTSKVRVVFDASCKGRNNVSLNDCLLVGPKLQSDLRHILMKWRMYRICLVADLVKMYRQVCVFKEDTDYQRILWRKEPSDKIKHYRMLRLTFGTACAPYLAVKSLQQLAKDESSKYPVAAEVTLRDFYMDDLMTSCESVQIAQEIYTEITKLMAEGGFKIQKWSSNNEEVLQFIKQDSIRSDQTLPIKENDTMKVLGIAWNRATDNFEYTINLPEIKEPITKRKVLSDISRLYDPMGWIAPIIINAKIFIQKLWIAGLEWDQTLPSDYLSEWLVFREELKQIESIRIPRWTKTTKCSHIELHAFSDASKVAYGAVVYLKVVNAEGISIHLITAKTKVAPIREVSIPRLELCAAKVAAQLLNEVSQVLNIPKSNLYAWTDSSVVLAWLFGLPNRWTTFVSNRVSYILNLIEFEQWGYVSTKENPADVASRGTSATELSNFELWWHGPHWLNKPTHTILHTSTFTTNQEQRTLTATTTFEANSETFVWVKYSTVPKMLRVISYCKRIFKKEKPTSIDITTAEIQQTLQEIVKQCQHFHFTTEVDNLHRGLVISKSSKLHSLNPFLDKNGVLRVGGRLEEAEIVYDSKHPIIIPSKSHLTLVLIKEAHIQTQHGGPQIMLNYLRTKYWILSGRQRVKSYYRQCMTCLRYKRVSKESQLMGQLPSPRVNKPSKAFLHTGTDYCGPIDLRMSKGRGNKCYKAYIALFVCLSTRAIHLELVSDLTTQGFLAAYKRFVSRRGYCSDFYSDNATNFVGASKELAIHNIQWHFIPPHAPNFGGLWEAGVKSAKYHLKRILGNSTLTFEEMSTTLSQIEACLNSRPITAISDNPDDPLPLTPGHFLIGEPILAVPNGDHTLSNITCLERWRLTQKMLTDFWNSWSKEYLVTLNQRAKWTMQRTEPDIDDIVILRDDNQPPAKWLLGRVIEKHPGRDNITRVVSVKTKNGVFKRPCSKLCLLPKE